MSKCKNCNGEMFIVVGNVEVACPVCKPNRAKPRPAGVSKLPTKIETTGKI